MTFWMVIYLISTCALLTLVLARSKDLANSANLLWTAWFLSLAGLVSLCFEPEMVFAATAAMHSKGLILGSGASRAAIMLLANLMLGLWSVLILAQLGLVFGYIARQVRRRTANPTQPLW